MELKEILTALRRWWYVLVIAATGSAAIAGGVTATQPPAYTASAQGIVSVTGQQQRPPYALSSGAQYILERMTSYAELGVTTPVLAPVVTGLNLQETPLTLSGRVKSHSIVGKALIDVEVTYNDPKMAANIADHILTEMGRSIGVLEKGNIALTPVGAASVPTEPSNGKTVLNAAVAGVGGLLLGCLIAIACQLLMRRRARVGVVVRQAPEHSLR